MTFQRSTLWLNVSEKDLQVPDVFAFPDQCQMLLNRADTYFFYDTADTRDQAAAMYRTLIARLRLLACAPGERNCWFHYSLCSIVKNRHHKIEKFISYWPFSLSVRADEFLKVTWQGK